MPVCTAGVGPRPEAAAFPETGLQGFGDGDSRDQGQTRAQGQGWREGSGGKEAAGGKPEKKPVSRAEARKDVHERGCRSVVQADAWASALCPLSSSPWRSSFL